LIPATKFHFNLLAMTTITLNYAELQALTGYDQPCKQLATLKARGFHRAYIARKGGVVLERTHYEAVTQGQAQQASQPKSANLAFLKPNLKAA
jgi:hypothetical protein